MLKHMMIKLQYFNVGLNIYFINLYVLCLHYK